MKKILKYHVPTTYGEFTLGLPEDADIICVKAQHYVPYLFAVASQPAPLVDRRFIWLRTDQEVPVAVETPNYIGTVQFSSYPHEFHLFYLP